MPCSQVSERIALICLFRFRSQCLCLEWHGAGGQRPVSRRSDRKDRMVSLDAWNRVKWLSGRRVRTLPQRGQR